MRQHHQLVRQPHRADSKLSLTLKRAVFESRCFRGIRQSQLAIGAGLHPTTLSALLHDALPIRLGDERVVRLGALVGVPAAECFDRIERGEISQSTPPASSTTAASM